MIVRKILKKSWHHVANVIGVKLRGTNIAAIVQSKKDSTSGLLELKR